MMRYKDLPLLNRNRVLEELYWEKVSFRGKPSLEQMREVVSDSEIDLYIEIMKKEIENENNTN